MGMKMKIMNPGIIKLNERYIRLNTSLFVTNLTLDIKIEIEIVGMRSLLARERMH
jgi:hypothetical protein